MSIQIPEIAKTITRRTPFKDKTKILAHPDMIPFYKEWINENDFRPQQLLAYLFKHGVYVGERLAPALKNILLENTIWKQDGELVCLCGFRSDLGGVMSRHRQHCPVHKEFLNKLDDEIFNPDRMRKLFNEEKVLVIDLVQMIIEQYNLPESYRHSIFNLCYKKCREFAKKGIIEWSSDADHVRKAYHERSKTTIREKYGVDNISQLEEIKRKKVETFRKHYGYDYGLQAPEIRSKINRTVREKYGVDNISQAKQIKLKKAKTFNEHYGVDNIFRLKEYMKRIWIQKFGVDNPTKHPLIKTKALLKGLERRADFFKTSKEELVYQKLSILAKSLFSAYSIHWNTTLFYNIDQKVVYLPDFVLNTPNDLYVIEFQDSYHMNPITNNISDTAYKIWYRDLKKLLTFKRAGYKIIFVWEEDIDKDLELLRALLTGSMSYEKHWLDNIDKRYPLYIQDKINTELPENIELHMTNIHTLEHDQMYRQLLAKDYKLCLRCGKAILSKPEDNSIDLWICDECLNTIMNR